MLDNNQGQNLDDQYGEDVNSSLGDLESDQQNNSSANSGSLSDQEDNPMTQSSANDEENNEEQPNLAADKADKNRNIASSFHDNTRRTTSRANEANDRLDSGSGGLSAGGNKSATDF